MQSGNCFKSRSNWAIAAGQCVPRRNPAINCAILSPTGQSRSSSLHSSISVNVASLARKTLDLIASCIAAFLPRTAIIFTHRITEERRFQQYPF